jgi:acetyl esterase/lipase
MGAAVRRQKPPANQLLLMLSAMVGCTVFAQPPPQRAVSWDDVASRPVPAATHRLAYGEEALQFGDLRLPDGDGPFPLAVVIHGGCWRAEYDLDHISHLSSALTRAGVATWTVEYRRIGDTGGGWTGTFDDVAAATEHVRSLATEFPLDPNRVVLVGHSAGGHLALWLAARRNLPEGSPLPSERPLPLRGIVALAGISDLRAFGAGSGSCNQAVPLLLGGTPDEMPERYRQASPIELMPLGVPQRLLHGELDAHVPVEQSRVFAARARSLGDDAELVVSPEAAHFDVIAPWSAAWPAVERTILELLGPR